MTNLTEELTDKPSTESIAFNSNSESDIQLVSDRVQVVDIAQQADNKSTEQIDINNSIPNSSENSNNFLKWAADRSGQSLIMLALLFLTLSVQFQDHLWLVFAGTAVLMMRAISYEMFSKHNILNHRGVRTNIKQVAKEESLIGLAFLAICFLGSWPPSAIDIVLFLVANLVAQGSITILLRELVFKEKNSQLTWPDHKLQSIIIVGTGQSALKMVDNILDHSELATRIEGFVDFERTGLYRYRDIPLIGHPDQIETIIGEKQVDLLLLALEPEQLPLTQELFSSAETMGTPIGLAVDWHKTEIARSSNPNIARTPVVVYHTAPENKIMLTIKTAYDRVLAIFGLLLLSPILLLTSIIIKLESKGPVFFKQIRSGINGKPFYILKFRTMCNDAEAKKAELMDQNEMSGPVFKISSDPRITKLGHYLRKFSIDELPQLINVVRGEMSLVGPRPPLPKEVAGMKPWQRRKLSVKPGVTCTWQVSGRNAIDFEEWMKLDLEYIDNWSMWNDIKLIARTIPTVIKGSGT